MELIPKPSQFHNLGGREEGPQSVIRFFKLKYIWGGEMDTNDVTSIIGVSWQVDKLYNLDHKCSWN